MRKPNDRIKCPDTRVREIHKISGRERGTCVGCGFQGWLKENGSLYLHYRDQTELGYLTLTGYTPLYMEQELKSFVEVCLECGVPVYDTDAHDDWHSNVIADLRYLKTLNEKNGERHEQVVAREETQRSTEAHVAAAARMPRGPDGRFSRVRSRSG